MRLLKALLTLALASVRAEYTSFEFIFMTNSIPSNGVQASAEVTHRPLELYWLSEIQKQNAAAVDLNIAKMIVQNTAASRVIRKYRKAHGNQRALIDFTYVFVLQVIGDGAQVQQSDVTGFFANTAFNGDADWTSVMNSHSISFQTAGLLHGTCKTEKGECREASVVTSACYDTHVIPFDENDSGAFDSRAQNLSATVAQLANAYYANSAFTINTEDTSVTVNSIVPNFPAAQETAQVVDVGSPGDQFYAQWNFIKSTTENIHTVCFSLTTTQNELFGQDVPTEQAIMDEAGLFIASLDNDKVNSQSVSYDYLCVAPSCDPPPVSTQCEGGESYNADLTDNGFLARFCQEKGYSDATSGADCGLYILKVISGRGFEGKNNKPAIPYDDDSYPDFPAHFDSDTVRLACLNGFSNGVAKPFVGSICTCANGTCAFQLANPDFVCLNHVTEQAVPVWAGGVFNFIKAVFPSYIVIKARVANLLGAAQWPFDKVDTDNNPQYLEQNYWKTADFTMFVFCPFDVRLGGMNKTGQMTFPDFYPGEHSSDGMLWSFLSREGTKLDRGSRCSTDENTGEIKCSWKSSYFKGFLDRSPNVNEQGPITYSTDFKTEDDWSCETGILPGHQPHAIHNMQYYYPAFSDGSFKKMIAYLRPSDKRTFGEDDLPVINENLN